MVGRMLRVLEVAERLSCSERTIRRRIADGTLTSSNIKGLRLVPEQALDQLIGGGDPAWLDAPDDAAETTNNPDDSARFATGFNTLFTHNIGEEE